jgi:hypothetical protein
VKSNDILKIGLPILVVGLTAGKAYSNACYNNPNVTNCDGQDPVVTGCINGAYVVNHSQPNISITCCCSAYQLPGGVGEDCGPGKANCASTTYNITVQLWWSPHCKTNWARTWIYNGYNHATYCDIWTNDGRSPIPFEWYQGNACYGNMRYAPNVGAKAKGGLWPTGNDSECFGGTETPNWV